jgi:hypothetical protein
MTHEKIFKRVDGSKVKLTAKLAIEWTSYSQPRWKFECHHCAQRKRTWVDVVDTDSYQWRRLSPEERLKSEMRDVLKYVTKEEIRETMRELIAKIPMEIAGVDEVASSG